MVKDTMSSPPVIIAIMGATVISASGSPSLWYALLILFGLLVVRELFLLAVAPYRYVRGAFHQLLSNILKLRILVLLLVSTLPCVVGLRIIF
jgi:hypothetical protein